MSDVLKIQILGGFRVSCGDKVIGTGMAKGNARKMWLLFGYLLMNYDRAVGQKELIDVLWYGTEVVNPTNSLKVLVFKLRRELDSLGFRPGGEIIQSAHGTYFFNNEIPHEIDALEFEKLVETASGGARSEDERMELLYRALSLYKGDVSEMAEGHPWLTALRTRFGTLYRDAVTKLRTILTGRGEYQKVVSVCNDALMRQPDEEVYFYYLISAYVAMGNYSAASEMYSRIKTLSRGESTHEQDLNPTEDVFLAAARLSQSGMPERDLSPGELTSDLEEKLDYVSGFFVEYDDFRQIYRMVARQLGQAIGIARLSVYSLKLREGAKVSEEEKQVHLRILENAIAFMLHYKTVFTRSGPTQYAVLLIDVSEEDALDFTDKVREYFETHRQNQDFSISHGMDVLESAHIRQQKRMNGTNSSVGMKTGSR